MKINQKLIEKYHDGKCTVTERQLVEDWLFAEESFEELDLPDSEYKYEHKALIWNEIKTILPHQLNVALQQDNISVQQVHVGTPNRISFSFWKYTIAATLIMGLLSVAVYHFIFEDQYSSSQLISIDNSAMLNVRHFNSDAGDISVGPNTFAKINYQSGTVDLSGSMLISPKKDIQLIFKGSREKVSFKTGQTYIILNSNEANEKPVVVNERNLMDLPPVLQQQIINHFSI